MTDEQFSRFLYAVAYDKPHIEALTADDFTVPQMEIVTAIIVVRKIGDAGNISNGIERIKKQFKTNFKPGSDALGKQKGGNKVKDPKAKHEKYLKISELIGNGMDQKPACEKIGISPKRYRDYRKKYLGVIDFN